MTVNWQTEVIYPIGTVLSVPATLGENKGVYAGGDKVIAGSRRAGRVMELTLAEFSNGRPISVAHRPGAEMEGYLWLDRAHKQLGQPFPVWPGAANRLIEEITFGEIRKSA